MSRMPPSLDRRTLLRGLAGLGVAGSTATLSLAAADGTEMLTMDPEGDGVTALDWVEGALWRSSGVATEFPLQVMFPADTVQSLAALDAHDSLDRVDVETAADSAARLQGADKGGFYSAAGDILGARTRSTHGAVVLSNRTGTDIDRDAAAGFLKTMQKQDGGFAPRYDFFGIDPLGSTLAATDHALWALQRINELDESTRQNALSFLQKNQTPQGGWPIRGEMVEPSTLGTYHALRALDALDADTQRNRENAAEYLVSMQADGGGFYAGDSPISCKPGCVDEPRSGIYGSRDANADGSGQDNCNRQNDADPWTCDDDQQRVTTYSTARGILGLDRVGHLDDVENLQKHADWLANQQTWDPEDPRYVGAFGPGQGSFYLPRNTTAMALRALAVLEDHGVTPDVDFDLGAAIDFLVECQHEPTGGFAGWPNYLQTMGATEAAVRSLSAFDADVPAEELADTLAATQRRTYDHEAMRDGAIPPEGWKYSVDTYQTASALLALSHAGHYGDVDVGDAAGWLADRQMDEEGGFGTYPGAFRPDLYSTNVAVLALDAVDELDRIDLTALERYYVDQQEDAGHFGPNTEPGYQRIAATSLAVRAVTAAGVGDVQGIDLGRAVDFLAALPADDGEYWPDPAKAGQAVMALDAVDELDRIDADATRAYLERTRMSSGGYVGRAFYSGYTAMNRHAAALSALSILGGSVGTAGEADPEGFEPAPNVEEVYGVPMHYPGRGVINHRSMLVDPDAVRE